MINLKIILSSTREDRKGEAIAQWIAADLAHHFARFNVSELDLKSINLPALSEPAHPKMGTEHYQHAHTKAWSAMIQDADALIILTPEYNGFFPGALKNALDYLYHEWAQKPVGIVSYGGGGGGARAAESLHTLLQRLNAQVIEPVVSIRNFPEYIDGEGRFNADGPLKDDLHKLGAALAIATEEVMDAKSEA